MTITAMRRWEPVLEALGTNPVRTDEPDPDGILRQERFLERAPGCLLSGQGFFRGDRFRCSLFLGNGSFLNWRHSRFGRRSHDPCLRPKRVV